MGGFGLGVDDVSIDNDHRRNCAALLVSPERVCSRRCLRCYFRQRWPQQAVLFPEGVCARRGRMAVLHLRLPLGAGLDKLSQRNKR